MATARFRLDDLIIRFARPWACGGSGTKILFPPEGIYIKPFYLTFKPLDELPVTVLDLTKLWVRVGYRREDGSSYSAEFQQITHMIRDE